MKWLWAAIVTGIVVLAGWNLAHRGEGSDGDRYVQSWPQDYAQTTCEEWLGEMTDAQQWAAAADMLAAARNDRDGGEGVPDDYLISLFQEDVTEGCRASGQVSVADAGAVVYLTGREKYRP